MPVVIFPSDPMNRRVVDLEYQHEMEYLRSLGMTIAFWNMEEPHRAPYVQSPSPQEVVFAFWRGWMLDDFLHQRLIEHVDALGWSHHLNQQRLMHTSLGWSSKLQSMFPRETMFAEGMVCTESMYQQALSICGTPLFVKSLVKSSGNVKPCFNLEEVNDQLHQIQKHRQNDNGFVLRQWLDLDLSTQEVRLFYVNDQLHVSSTDHVWFDVHHQEVKSVIRSISNADWCSLDFAVDKNGTWWLMEIGDASVTGWKYYG